MKHLRSCAYCGLPGWRPEGDTGPRCGCKYRAGRMGGAYYVCSNISRETTVEEFSKSVEDLVKHFYPKTKVVFSFSLTKLDEKKIAKADEKRHTKKVADRLLGKGRK